MWRRLSRANIAILGYHGVCSAELPFDNPCQSTPREFEDQIELAAEMATVLPLSEIIERIELNRPLPSRTVAITFDDAFASVVQNALPVLERRGLPATIFVVTGLAETGSPPWPELVYQAFAQTVAGECEFGGYVWILGSPRLRQHACHHIVEQLKRVPTVVREKTMPGLFERLAVTPDNLAKGSVFRTLTWDGIESLSHCNLIEFGSHTHTHPILSQCSSERMKSEVETSCEILRARLGKAKLFAFPNGLPRDFTPETIRLLKKNGVCAAVTMVSGVNRRRCDVFELKRIAARRGMTLGQFEVQLAGL